MRLSVQEYFQIRNGVNQISDLDKFNFPRGILHSILIQKKVENVKNSYHFFLKRGKEILECWRKNNRFPKWLNLTPVMKVRLLLKAMDFSTKEINKALINPDILDSKLSDLVYRAVTMDFVYSPIATKIQCVFGQIGERIVEEELKNLKIKFKREKELKTQKTPDFLFEEPLEIFERKIRWIESKSLFADHRVYEIYSKKQFLKYREIFGEGLVIFWLGCLEGIEVSDGSEFGADLKNKLLEMKIKVIVDEEIDGNPLKITEDFIMRYADCHRFPYNSEVIRILKNMGFVVEKED